MTSTRAAMLLTLALFLLPSVSTAEHLHLERWYQDKWCAEQGGQTEVVMPDGTRCDCLTATHAIEFDFANKWAEAIGQSLWYAFQTQKKAGIVLILENAHDSGLWMRLNSVIEGNRLPIDTWEIK